MTRILYILIVAHFMAAPVSKPDRWHVLRSNVFWSEVG